MYDEVIVGNTNEHLIKALRYRYPIVITKFEYLEFENYIKPVEFFGLSLNQDLGIARKKPAYSQLYLREKLLFFLQLYGLLIEDNIYNIYINSDTKTLTLYGMKNKLRKIQYKNLYLLDTHKITYDDCTINFGWDYIYVIDSFVFNVDKEQKIYIKVDNIDPVRELYYFNKNMYSISRMEKDKMFDDEYSQVEIRVLIENYLHKNHNVNIPMKISISDRYERPQWQSIYRVRKNEIKYELS